MKDIIKLSVVLALTSWLVGCGQTGPLYMPGTKTPYGPAEYSPFHPPRGNDEQQTDGTSQQKPDDDKKTEQHEKAS